MWFTKDGIRALHAWTHGSLDLLIDHAAAMAPELFVSEVPGFGKASIRDQLLHIVSCEDFWVRGLQGLPLSDWPPGDYRTVPSLAQAKLEVMTSTLKYLDGLSQSQLNDAQARCPQEWEGPPRSPAFILHHVFTHAFHHKGQVVAMFRLLAHPAPDTDLQRSEN